MREEDLEFLGISPEDIEKLKQDVEEQKQQRQRSIELYERAKTDLARILKSRRIRKALKADLRFAMFHRWSQYPEQIQNGSWLAVDRIFPVGTMYESKSGSQRFRRPKWLFSRIYTLQFRWQMFKLNRHLRKREKARGSK
jgi:hypothetical protein